MNSQSEHTCFKKESPLMQTSSKQSSKTFDCLQFSKLFPSFNPRLNVSKIIFRNKFSNAFPSLEFVLILRDTKYN
jgi:hypothetical protein